MGFQIPRFDSEAVPAYVAACGVVLLAVALQSAIEPWVGTQLPFLFFVPGVVLTAVSLGRGPALLVLMAGCGLAPVQGLAPLATFLCVGGALVLYGGHLHLTTRRAALAEQRLTLAQDNTGTGVFELDFASNRAVVSPSLCQLLGQPVMKGSIPLDVWLNALNQTHVQDSLNALQQHLARGERQYESEHRIELAQGGIRWLLTRVRIETNAAGTITQARGATVDITARKEAEERLQRIEAELRQQVADLERVHRLSERLVAAGEDLSVPMQALLETVAEVCGTTHGLVMLRGAAGCEWQLAAQLGFDPARLVSLPRDSAAAGALAEDPHYQKILDAHQALASESGLPTLHAVPLRAEGRVMGLLSLMFARSDARTEREIRLCEVCATTAAAVLERQRARLAAAENAKRFAVTLESASVAFSILTPVREPGGSIVDFRWTYMNPAAARALGGRVEQLSGQRIGEVLPKAWDPPGLFTQYVQAVESGRPCDFEVHSNATGNGGWFYVIASPLEGSLAVWFADVSERKRQTQALQDADRRKDEFLATLAHELRNPLAPIRQAVRIARTPTASVEQRRWGLDVIERQVQAMSLLLDDLLDVSRITRGTLLVRKAATTLAAVVDSAVETARPHLEAKRHRLELELSDPSLALEVDPLRVSQVLGNLLTNAAKYTDPEGIIRLHGGVEDNSLVLRVADNGIGLTPEQLGQLFVMFSQVSAAAGRSQGGLGIGLALSRGLIELHGGALEAQSAGPGRGAEFTVRLPAACLVSAKPVPAPPSLGSTLPTPRRILVADDNVDAADSLAELLRLGGHEVRVAYDGEQALQTFRAFEPAAALLDIGMPHLSGLDVVQAIRRLPAGDRAVLIAITGWGQEPDRQRALAAGFDHHLTKPTDPVALQALIAGERDPRRAALAS